MFLLSFYWDPDPVAFYLPGVGHPIVWYGILFAFGFFLGCLVTRRIAAWYLADWEPALEGAGLQRLAASYTDRLLAFTVVGTVVGARLGHIAFYDLGYYLQHPIQIFKIWEGGLASHGAAIGVAMSLLALRLRPRGPYPRHSVLQLLDIVVVPAALIGGFIRVGNFINQELVGLETRVPWGVVFGSPASGLLPAARHPVQLYEAVSYLVTFGCLVALACSRAVRARVGLVAGTFFVAVFGARFGLEFFKETQAAWLQSSWLDMGQLLSLPLVVLGVVLVSRSLVSTPSPTQEGS